VPHRAGPGRPVGTEVVAVAFEGFIHESATTQDDTIAEVPDPTPQCLSLRESAAGVEDGLDGFLYLCVVHPLQHML